jgi:competence protein ComEC
LQGLVALVPFGTSWPVNRLGVLGTLSAAGGAALWLLPWRRGARVLAGFLLLPFLWPGRPGPAQPQLAVHVLDVGQGLAVIVRTPGNSLVYDSGPLYPSGFDSGVALVVPVLRSFGIDTVDRLIISHGDNDHAGGARGLLATLPVGDVLVGETLTELPGRTSPCVKGQQWRWERVQFRILHPEPGGARHGNNSSCVLEIQVDDLRILLPGDVDAAVERQLLAGDAGLDEVTVLVSAHHGSNTSSSWTFLAATRPDLVVHSAGYGNQFGHPTAKVRDRIDTLGIAQLLTAEQGMISLYYASPGQALEVLRYRDQRQRYWHWSDIPK